MYISYLINYMFVHVGAKPDDFNVVSFNFSVSDKCNCGRPFKYTIFYMLNNTFPVVLVLYTCKKTGMHISCWYSIVITAFGHVSYATFGSIVTT